jgi:putative aminopeptidase FrvX
MRTLEQLSQAIGVSGAEDEVRMLIVGLIREHADEIRTDALGNVLTMKKGTGRRRLRVMIAAHMDEIGLMVVGHDNDGMLRVAAVGGLDDRILLGKRVLVGPDKLPGVIGAKPIHLLDDAEYKKVVKLDTMRVDIGATSKDQAKSKAPLGVRAAFDMPFVDLGPTVRGKAFDDRVGCAVLVELLRGEPFRFDLYGVFSVQEEVGLRGARVASHAIEPNAAFVLEGTIADDLPKEDDVSPTTQLGKGPALSLMDRATIYDRRLNALLTATAEELGIPYQFKQPGIGATDAGAIERTKAGVPTAAVSVPCRYIHSPAAILNKRDFRNAVRLMREALNRLDRNTLERRQGT